MLNRFLILFTLIPTIYLSQGNYQDFGTWTKINSDFKINKKTSFTNKIELRTFDNSRQINQIYSQFSFQRKLNKKLQTSFAWRLRFDNEEYSYNTSNRFHNDITYQKKYSDFKIYLRLRSQFHIYPIKLNELFERTRIKVQYKINKKIKIYLYNEQYFLMNRNVTNKHKKNRFGTGIKYELNKKTNLELKYLKIVDINVESPISFNIVGFKIRNKF